jgi:hypothetical protein
MFWVLANEKEGPTINCSAKKRNENIKVIFMQLKMDVRKPTSSLTSSVKTLAKKKTAKS